jgi:hypothetical protein
MQIIRYLNNLRVHTKSIHKPHTVHLLEGGLQAFSTCTLRVGRGHARPLLREEAEERIVKKSLTFVWGSIVPISLVALAIPARADVVYSNFGPAHCAGDPACIADNGINQNFDAVAGTTQTFDPGTVEMIANSFTAGGNFTLTDVKLPLQSGSGLNGTANVYLTANNAGVPGAVLESWLGVTGEAFALPQVNALSLASVLNPALTNGTEYWLVVGPATADSAAGWNYTWFGPAASALNLLANSTPNAGIPTLAGPWAYDGQILTSAFQIDGTPTVSTSPAPEPQR